MFRKLLSRRNRISICLGLLAMVGGTCVPGSRSLLAATPAAHEDGRTRNVYYTLAFSTGAGELWAIEVTGGKITTTNIGPTKTKGCAALAMSPSGTLMSMCGPLFGNQQLTSFDTKTGLATLFGVPVPGLAVMAMAFGPDGTLYAVGGCTPNGNPNDLNTDCSGSDPNFNSLYTVNEVTGAFTRIGPTGAPQYFMDLAFDRHGNLYGVTTTLNPSYVPSILYRINPETGAATKIVNLVGSNSVMGLAFARDGKLYATDFTGASGLYVIDPKTGFESAVAAMPFGLSTGLELADPLPEPEDRN
jgi:DNA-binding beta-propeller fold protein YncE